MKCLLKLLTDWLGSYLTGKLKGRKTHDEIEQKHHINQQAKKKKSLGFWVCFWVWCARRESIKHGDGDEGNNNLESVNVCQCVSG